MARKKQAEEKENHERWLVSYADFVTLLLAFFIAMYAVSRVDNKRLQHLAESIRWALHLKGTGGVSEVPIFQGPPSEGGCLLDLGSGSRAQARLDEAELLRTRLESRLKGLLEAVEGHVTLVVEGERVLVRLAASKLFDSGQALFRPDMLPVLDAIASELVSLKRPIRVEAHTDSQPLVSSRFRNNWELSAARAATVAAFLEEAHGVAPELLSAVGFGSTRPLASEDTAEGRERNRRLELSVELPVPQAQPGR